MGRLHQIGHERLLQPTQGVRFLPGGSLNRPFPQLRRESDDSRLVGVYQVVDIDENNDLVRVIRIQDDENAPQMLNNIGAENVAAISEGVEGLVYRESDNHYVFFPAGATAPAGVGKYIAKEWGYSQNGSLIVSSTIQVGKAGANNNIGYWLFEISEAAGGVVAVWGLSMTINSQSIGSSTQVAGGAVAMLKPNTYAGNVYHFEDSLNDHTGAALDAMDVVLSGQWGKVAECPAVGIGSTEDRLVVPLYVTGLAGFPGEVDVIVDIGFFLSLFTLQSGYAPNQRMVIKWGITLLSSPGVDANHVFLGGSAGRHFPMLVQFD